MKEWTVERLIRTAQSFDNNARCERKSDTVNQIGLTYSQNRKFAFDARKWARNKKND